VRSKDSGSFSKAIGDGKEEGNVLRYGDNLMANCQRLQSAGLEADFHTWAAHIKMSSTPRVFRLV